MKYAIFAGLGGGYGGDHFICFEDHINEENAEASACEHSRDEWESYGGMAGVEGYDYDEYLKEYPDGTEIGYDDMDNDSFESWAAFHVEEFDPEKDYD